MKSNSRSATSKAKTDGRGRAVSKKPGAHKAAGKSKVLSEFRKVLNRQLDLAGCPPLNYGRHKWVATRYVVSDTAARKWVNGENLPEADSLVMLADDLNVSLDELLGRTPTVPVKNTISVPLRTATSPSELESPAFIFGNVKFEEGILDGAMRMPIDGLELFVVPTDSMSPQLDVHDLAFVDTTVTKIEDNKIYLFSTKDRFLIRRCFIGIDNTVQLCSDNEQYERVTVSMDDIHVGAPKKSTRVSPALQLLGEIPWAIKRITSGTGRPPHR